jgi:hypothetical protein
MDRTPRPVAAIALAVAGVAWLLVSAVSTLTVTVSRVGAQALAPLLPGLVVSVLLWAALVLAVLFAVPAARALATGVVVMVLVSVAPSLWAPDLWLAVPILVFQVLALVALWLPVGTRSTVR